MALVHVTLANVQDRAQTGSTLPIPAAADDGADTLTSSGTSQLASLTAAEGQVWVIATTGNIWVKFGSGTPLAATDSGFMLTAGVHHFGADASQKVAIKDAA